MHNPMTLNRAIARIIRDYNAEEMKNAKKEKSYAEATEGKKQEVFKNLEGKIKIG